MIPLQYRYFDKKSETWIEGRFKFDDYVFCNYPNNWLNVVSDFLDETIGKDQYEDLTVKKIKDG